MAKFNRTYTCTCQHAGHWHRPNCRIPHCDCQRFEHATVDTITRHMGTVPQAQPPGQGRRRRQMGVGPS